MVLVHLLKYIRDNKALGFKYYACMKDFPLSGLLRQANINTKNQLLVFSVHSWNHFLHTGRSTGSYFIFYRFGPIDHGTHFPRPFS